MLINILPPQRVNTNRKTYLNSLPASLMVTNAQIKPNKLAHKFKL